MHRLNPNPRTVARGVSPRVLLRCMMVAFIAASSLGSLGCASPKVVVQDPPFVERLRIRITKVRNAIEETRKAITLSRGAPYLPELYVRLAELLSEEAKYHYQVAYEREQRASQVLHAPQVRFLKEEAIGVYEMVLRKYPKSDLVDRVLFNIGHEERELGNYDNMIKVLDRLVDEHVGSPLRPEALLVLGDYWFDKGELDSAERYYEKIVQGPPNKTEGLAWYKIGWVWVNRQECKRSLNAFEKAIAADKKWFSTYEGPKNLLEDRAQAVVDSGGGAGSKSGGTSQSGAIDVRREALVDSMYCFARERKAKTALDYLRDKAYNRSTYIAALERLAGRYAVINQAEGGIKVTRELLRLAPTDPDRLDDARLLYAAVKKAKAFDNVGEDIELITDAMQRQISRVETTAEMRQLVTKEFEAYTRDLATRAQQAMQADQKKKGKLDKELAASVADAYEAYLESFPEAEAREDMVLNLADVYDVMQSHMNAGLRAAEAADIVTDDKKRQDYLYDAVVHFQSSLEILTERDQVERVVVRAALRRAGRELLAYKLTDDKARNVKLAIAQTYYDEGFFREAIDRLQAVAYEYPGSKEANAAIHLVLDAFNTLNDYEGLIAVGRRFMGAGSPADAAMKAEIKPIVDAAEKRKLDELSLAAAGDEGGDLAPLEDFADRYKGTSLGERALLNAFVAARAQGDSDKLYKLGQEIIEKYPKSEQIPGIIATLAKTSLATFDYDKAIALYDKAARANPDERVRLLVSTGNIYESLADTDKALNAYRTAVSSAKEPGQMEAAGTAMAQLLEQLGDPRKTVEMLQPLTSSQNPEVNARLGLAQIRLGQVDQGEMTLQIVIGDAAGASPGARARAQYGVAEALAKVLFGYQPQGNLDSIQEYLALIEVTEQAYLNAARQGDPTFTPAALARLAYMSDREGRRLGALPVPSDLSGDEARLFKQGLEGRVQQLAANAKEALKACSEQAWSNKVFSVPVRKCLAGEMPASSPVGFDTLKSRSPAGNTGGAAELRQKLAKNPNDLDTLRALGSIYLDAGDPHLARLVFARAVQAGGGPEDLNLLGVASFKAGDVTGALDAFGQAADGGLEAARQNLADALRKLGLGKAASTALEKWPEGKGAGRRL